MTYDLFVMFVFFFKQKTAYEMRISDWSSDVCSSDLVAAIGVERGLGRLVAFGDDRGDAAGGGEELGGLGVDDRQILVLARLDAALRRKPVALSPRDPPRGVAEELEPLQRSVPDQQFERAGEREVADGPRAPEH